MTRPNVLDPASWCLAPVEFDGEPPEPVTAKVVYASPLCVDLGCGPRKPEGYFGIDRHAWEGVDLVADLAQGIPLPDDSVDELRAHDILEHLPDIVLTMNQLFRVLKPGGTAEILVPSTDGRGAWQDPTHKSFWNRNTFWYFQAQNPHREIYGDAYGIQARFDILELGEIRNEEFGIVHVRAVLKAVKA